MLNGNGKTTESSSTTEQEISGQESNSDSLHSRELKFKKTHPHPDEDDATKEFEFKVPVAPPARLASVSSSNPVRKPPATSSSFVCSMTDGMVVEGDRMWKDASYDRKNEVTSVQPSSTNMSDKPSDVEIRESMLPINKL